MRDGVSTPENGPLLSTLARHIRGGDPTGDKRADGVGNAAISAWPLNATSLLADLTSGTPDLATVQARLRGAAERTEPMTARKRGLLWVAHVVPLLVFAIFSAVMQSLLSPPSADVARMQPLLSFLRDSTQTDPDIRTQKHLVAVYMVTHFRDRIIAQRTTTDSAVGIPANGFVSRREWALADSLVRTMPAASPDEVRQADVQVDQRWNGRPPGARNVTTLMPLFLGVAFALFAAIFAMLSSLLARRGLLMRLLGLELVNRKGAPASRLRLAWRQLLIWLPLSALAITGVTIAAGNPGSTQLVIFGVSLVLVAVATFTAWRQPSRGLTERLSGTLMVPE